MTQVFVLLDGSTPSQKALGLISQVLAHHSRSEVEDFIAELRRRNLQGGLNQPAVLTECSMCGTQRALEPEQLGWLIFCDICGHLFAEPRSPWSLCRAERAILRTHAPFSQVTGRLQRTPLTIALALDAGAPQPVSTGKRAVYICAKPGQMLMLSVENAGSLPMPAGYLSCRSLGGDIVGPRPLRGPGERQTFAVEVPEFATAICVDFHPPRGTLKNVATANIVPLGGVTWAVRECEPPGYVRMDEAPLLVPYSPRFNLDVRFAGPPPLAAGAQGHLRLPNRTYSLRCLVAASGNVHEWAATLDIEVPHRCEFEVRLTYPEIVGQVQLRGALRPKSEVAEPHPHLLRLPETSVPPPDAVMQPATTAGWGVPLVIDANACGAVAGCADGQQSLYPAPITRVDSIVDAAEALQIRADTSGGLDEATIGDTQSVVLDGALEILEHLSISALEVGWRPLDSGPGARLLDAFAKVSRQIIRKASDKRAGRPDQLALLFPPNMSRHRLQVAQRVLEQTLTDVRIYLDIDRASALILRYLTEDLSRLPEIDRASRALVIDVSYEQTTISMHRLQREASIDELHIQLRSAVTLKAGYLDVIDQLACTLVEPMLRGEAFDDDSIGSIETLADESLWLFSPDRRREWLARTTILAAPDEARTTDHAAFEPRPADGAPSKPPQPVSSVRRTILRLLTASLVIRSLEQQQANLDGITHAELLVGRLLTEMEFDPLDAEIPPTDLLARCIVSSKPLQRVLDTIAQRLVEPAREVVTALLRSSTVGERTLILVHAPSLLGKAIRNTLGQWCAPGHSSPTAEIVALPTEDAPAVRGAMTFYEAARLGTLDVKLRVSPPVDRLPFAIECLTPAQQTLIPAACPHPLAVGYMPISNPAVILGLRTWFDGDRVERIALSLDSLPYRPGVDFGVASGVRSASTTRLLKLVARGTPGSDELSITCDVVEITGGTISQLERHLANLRSQVDQGETQALASSCLPPGLSEHVLTMRPIEILRRPRDIAAPVDLSPKPG